MTHRIRTVPPRLRRGLAAAFVATLLIGVPPSPARAAADPPARPRVAYDGDALVVDGARYAPQVDAEECGSAEVLCRRSTIGVAWRKGFTLVEVANRDIAAVTDAISRFGLPVRTTPWHRGETRSFLFAEVPTGFELHWSLVLARLDGVIRASTAPVMATDPRWTPATPGMPTAPDVQYDGDTLVVRGVRYERQPGMQYCRDDPSRVCARNGGDSRELGSIRIVYRSESKLAFLSRLREAGLTPVEEIERSHTIVVQVPGFFEAQWEQALAAEQDVRVAPEQPSIRSPIRSSQVTVSHQAGGVAVTSSQRERIAMRLGQALAADQCGRPLAIVVGHADLRETSDPARLSAARADHVRDLIVQRAGGAARVVVESKAASRPAAPAGQPENARTEVEFIAEMYGKDCAAK